LFRKVPELLGLESVLWGADGRILTGRNRNIRILTYLTAVWDKKQNFLIFPPVPPHVLVDFVVFPPGHGRSVTGF